MVRCNGGVDYKMALGAVVTGDFRIEAAVIRIQGSNNWAVNLLVRHRAWLGAAELRHK